MPKAEPWESKPRVIDRQKRVALPSQVLDALGVESGDYLTFTVNGANVSLHRVRWSKEA